jgi:DNA-binding LytR/AlgR family response regulator
VNQGETSITISFFRDRARPAHLRTFDAGAADYLLKPIRQDRLRAAIEKARSAIKPPVENAEDPARTLEATGPTGDRPQLSKKGEACILLELEEVLAFRAVGELVWIIRKKRRYFANQNLQQLSACPNGTQFRAAAR